MRRRSKWRVELAATIKRDDKVIEALESTFPAKGKMHADQIREPFIREILRRVNAKR